MHSAIPKIPKKEVSNVKNGKYYSSVRYRKKDYKGLIIGILSAVLILLVALCIWAIATFAGGGEGAFKNQTDILSDLKIENETLKIENAELKEEIEKYKNGFYDEEPEPKPTPAKDEDDDESKKDKESDKNKSSDKDAEKESEKESKKSPKPSKSPKQTATPKPTPTPAPTPAETQTPAYESDGGYTESSEAADA